MNDLQLIALVAETNRYPAAAPLPEDVAGVDAAFASLVGALDGAAEQDVRIIAPSRRLRRLRRDMRWALAAFVAVMAIGAFIFTISRLGTENTVVDQPTTTTIAPTTTAAPPSDASGWTPGDDVALAEAAFAAWYGNDFETVSDLLAIPGGTDQHAGWSTEDVRNQMAYDAAVGGRAGGLDCSEPEEEGRSFECRYTLLNTLTDAVGFTPERPAESVPFRVVDGSMVLYEFADNIWVNQSFAIYLGGIGQVSGYENCIQAPLDAACAEIQLAHLDGWVRWHEKAEPVDVATARVDAFFGGDCLGLWAMGGPGLWGGAGFDSAVRGDPDRCPPGVEYELELEGSLVLSNCEATLGIGTTVGCDGEYSNALSRAVGAAPAQVSVSLSVGRAFGAAWDDSEIRSAHPEDRDLARSVRIWARETGLSEAVDAACGTASPEKSLACATFILDNLDAWAAWYLANS